MPTGGITVPPRYRYEEIADDLEKRIEAGEFPPGSRLPSRRELIEHYGVTEPVVDRAMQNLRAKGITETLPGVGVYVRER
ncbi:winged helix-turn-helix domain-containing protein [Plantactinospora sp. KLBMP9567]|uniref:winged helix-turn-helix domain-containing protein n=1 Tax=Plantactinospora sp. KLBMP9567 TaxID=3085900 RepID=UPI0039905DE7